MAYARNPFLLAHNSKGFVFDNRSTVDNEVVRGHAMRSKTGGGG